MRIHYLQHVPFEGIGSMETYFINCGCRLSSTQLYLDESFPELHDFDWLIVMGGPMGVADESQYTWMSKEKAFIKSSIESGKIVLGICLGAQLIAEALGAKVYKNYDREIGWFPIDIPEQVNNTILRGVFPQGIEVFHWHGETFDIPVSGILLASSKACQNQGFIVDNRIVGLQFHLETTLDSAKALVENCRNELDGSKFIQNEKEMLAQESRFLHINQVMIAVLERLRTQIIPNPAKPEPRRLN
ncbi:MAG: type 1 glutamine amidotransferase [Deltaproteobacteria bacterium]|nr:type 1 glutamine amidotransferase [Candidatus Tharpella aukensis]